MRPPGGLWGFPVVLKENGKAAGSAPAFPVLPEKGKSVMCGPPGVSLRFLFFPKKTNRAKCSRLERQADGPSSIRGHFLPALFFSRKYSRNAGALPAAADISAVNGVWMECGRNAGALPAAADISAGNGIWMECGENARALPAAAHVL